eukprot:TRINITY_DN3811_c0_g1_i6.p1 TRINITY_DN3811_c0_g1~~TRINITY_DN3811_c0_g1_i6.p1  ORF type:complete len:635 (-),score=159.19 TRINITY_DN3811_c0_g1_i6:11-1915(-)
MSRHAHEFTLVLLIPILFIVGVVYLMHGAPTLKDPSRAPPESVFPNSNTNPRGNSRPPPTDPVDQFIPPSDPTPEEIDEQIRRVAEEQMQIAEKTHKISRPGDLPREPVRPPPELADQDEPDIESPNEGRALRVNTVEGGTVHTGGGGIVGGDAALLEGMDDVMIPSPQDAVPTPGGGSSGGNANTNERMDAVRDAFKHAYKSYTDIAWGMDELMPQSRRGEDWLGLGLTIVDSLDTMHLMGLTKEFDEGREWVANNLRFDKNRDISFFETTIRVVGGLLTAYELTGDKMFLNKAEELGERMLPAFDTPTGIPFTTINLATRHARNPDWNGRVSILSEAGTVQMEAASLSHHTGKKVYNDKARRVITSLDGAQKPSHGLYPVYVDPQNARFTRPLVTLGALGDSFYEYLLKMWILTGKKDDMFRRMYMDTAGNIIKHLIKTSTPTGLTYIAEYENGPVDKMDHLVCFAGGMFALGAHHKVMGDDEELQKEHMRLGKEITRTCHEMYARQSTGLAPELVRFNPGSDFMPGATKYILRPETVESYFVLYRLTGDTMYQDWGWEAFQAMERYCRTPDGYVGVRDVNEGTGKDDKQQSFFLAETLKYLYLLFAPTSLTPLDEYVFTTEAHPLKIFNQK